MTKFDPNAVATEDSGIFGLPFSEKESQLVLLPVPWEVTTSYGGGTSQGPNAILTASKQVDLFDIDVLRPYEPGICMLPESSEVQTWNTKGRKLALDVIEMQTQGKSSSEMESALIRVNQLGDQLNQYVYRESSRILKSGKLLGIVGGDHSVPWGGFKAVSEQHASFGILHFDAHSDTRKAYEGFTWSHASIMYNALSQIPQITQLVQVGIRDFCEDELDYIKSQGTRMKVYFDRDLSYRKFEGEKWIQISQDIIRTLPDKVWISFDIDGLDPRFCPNTGTPVPGGLDFSEANYLISILVKSGRKIIGFDLNEVAPDIGNPSSEWDANVGARLLYKLCGWTLASQGKAQIRV